MQYRDSNKKIIKVRLPQSQQEYLKLQTLHQISVLDKRDAVMPETNRNFIRLYGHYMCPYVERVRLVLAALNIPYQTCMMNLAGRTKWHKEVNNGFVPMLQLPSGQILTESLVIMRFLATLTGDEPFATSFKDRLNIGKALLPQDPVARAAQEMMISRIESSNLSAIFGVLMQHGESPEGILRMQTTLEQLEKMLAA